MKKIMLTAVAIATLFTFTSCEEKTTAEKAEDKIENAAEELGDVFRNDQEELRKDIRDAREDVNEKITSIREDMKDASKEARTDMQGQIDKLDRAGAKLDKDLEKVGESVKESWNDFKDGVSKTIENIEKDLES